MTEFDALRFTTNINASLDKSYHIETPHLNVLTGSVRQLNRLVISYQFSLGEALRNGKNYWFTHRDSETLFKLFDTIRLASKALHKEIEHNLEILYVPDAVDRKNLRALYYGPLLDYKTSVDSFSANVHSLALSMNGLYSPLDTMDEEDIRDTHDQLPTRIYLDILERVRLEIENTKTIIFSNEQIIIDLKNVNKIDLALATDVVETINATITKPTCSWKGDKTDLAELVWALTKSNRIIDNATSQPVTQIALVRQLETLLGVKLDVPGLMKGRMSTYKMNKDGKSFTATLQELVNERAAST